MSQLALRFNGPAYIPERDNARLGDQIHRIFNLMQDGKYRTLSQIAEITGDPPASISAQLRHLRKSRFGSHEVDKRYLGEGLYEYRVTVNLSFQQLPVRGDAPVRA